VNHFYNPVHTIEGAGCLHQLPQLLKTLPETHNRILLLGWSQNALEHPAIKALQKDDAWQVETLVFTPSNPTVEQLFEAWESTKDFSPQVVVGIGGGTILDVAKSLCCLYGQEMQDPDALREKIIAGGLKPEARWIGVPTTAGTGSEVTCWATIWDPSKNAKRSLESKENYAWAALVDPELAQGMPVKLAVSSALDAVAHAVESYWAKGSNAVSKGLALEAIRTIMGQIDGLFSNSMEAHDAMARGSMLAGLAFSNTKTTACHSISYPLTMGYNIPHGTAVSMLLAPVLKLNSPVTPCPQRLLEALGTEDPAALQQRVTQLLTRSGQAATLQGWGVKREDLPRLAALGMTKGRADNNPAELNAEKIEALLQTIYE
jgi:alcohol dehydrogenase class IV